MRASARVFDPVESLEDIGQFVGRNSDPRVAHPQSRRPVFSVQRNFNPAGQGELERVGKQVEHDLLPHVPIHIHGLRQRRAVNPEIQSRLFHRGAEHARQIRRQRRQVCFNINGAGPPGFDSGKIKKGVDQFQQTEAVAVNDFQLRHILGMG